MAPVSGDTPLDLALAGTTTSAALRDAAMRLPNADYRAAVRQGLLVLVLGFGGGYWLDGLLGTKPWLSFLGFFMGLAAGVLNVYRVMQLANKKS